MQDDDARKVTFKWIGKRLRWAREQIPLTQTEFARSLGITTVTLSHAEAGKRALSVLSLITAANRLRTGTEYLLTGELVAVEPELRERLVMAHPELLRPEGRPAFSVREPEDPARLAEEAAQQAQLQEAMALLSKHLAVPRPRRGRGRPRRPANEAASPGAPQEQCDTDTRVP